MLPSLQEYVLIGSEYKAIEVYRREAAFWKQDSDQEGQMVELSSMGVRSAFDRVYRGIRLRSREQLGEVRGALSLCISFSSFFGQIGFESRNIVLLYESHETGQPSCPH
jgi:hypothetical protein